MQADLDQQLTKILQDKAFGDQSELLAALSKQGFTLTQSTLSRKLQALGFAKQNGVYRQQGAQGAMLLDVIAVPPNLLVLKTAAGFANALAVKLDVTPLPGQAGTIAGDDTVFVAVLHSDMSKAQAAARALMRNL